MGGVSRQMEDWEGSERSRKELVVGRTGAGW